MLQIVVSLRAELGREMLWASDRSSRRTMMCCNAFRLRENAEFGLGFECGVDDHLWLVLGCVFRVLNVLFHILRFMDIWL